MNRFWVILVLVVLLPVRGWAVAGMGLPQTPMPASVAADWSTSVEAPSAAMPCHGAMPHHPVAEAPAAGLQVCNICDLCHLVALPTLDAAPPLRDRWCSRVPVAQAAFPPDAPPSGFDKPPRL